MASLDNLCMDTHEDHEMEEGSMDDIKKSLMSDFSDDSPVKAPTDGSMPPPPPPNTDEGSDTMKVYLRVRPLKEDEKAAGEDQGCVKVNGSSVDLSAPKTSKAYTHGGGKLLQTFSFNEVYDGCISQKVLFEDAMLGTIKDFVDGQNCLVFAYGVTNSGKTYTMLGTPGEQGIIPRSLEVIFNSVGAKQFEHSVLRPQLYSQVKELTPSELAAADKFKSMVLSTASKAISDSSDLYSSCDSLVMQSSISDADIDGELDGEPISISTEGQGEVKFSVWVSFAEIYNEQIHDLLEPPTKTKRKTLILREDRNGNPYIKDLRHIQVCSAEEAVKVMAYGQRNLQYACTKLNESSSRSHCIFNVKIVRVADVLHPSRAQMSQLSFCDLAGSERYSRTGSLGDRLKEAANINTSLLTLGRCLKILRQNQQSKVAMVVPFRESKLTRLFQTFFCRKGRASMIVNLSPAASSFDENLNVLKFSAIAKQVQIIPEKIVAAASSKTRTGVSLQLEQGLSMADRKTIQWGSTDDLEEGAEDDEEVHDTVEHYHVAIEKLKNALIETNELLKQERKAKKKLESKLRAEICQEMIHQVTEIESNYQQQLESQRQRCEDAADEKVKLIASAVRKSVKWKQEESEEALRAKLDSKELELQETRAELQEMRAELQETRAKLTVTREKLMLKESLTERENTEEGSSEREMDIASNEIVLAITRQLEESRSLVKEKEALIADLEETLEEAKDTFNTLSSENSTLQAKNQSLAERNATLEHECDQSQKKVAGMEKKGPFYKLFGKENAFSPLSKLRGSNKAASTASLPSVGSAAHQVTSTFATPYKAMHTKSSLLRIKAAHHSPCKVNRCLDNSCHVNTCAGDCAGSKHKSSRLIAETRATKKRKAATKRRASNVLRRVYETRSRKKKKSDI